MGSPLFSPVFLTKGGLISIKQSSKREKLISGNVQWFINENYMTQSYGSCTLHAAMAYEMSSKYLLQVTKWTC